MRRASAASLPHSPACSCSCEERLRLARLRPAPYCIRSGGVEVGCSKRPERCPPGHTMHFLFHPPLCSCTSLSSLARLKVFQVAPVSAQAKIRNNRHAYAVNNPCVASLHCASLAPCFNPSRRLASMDASQCGNDRPGFGVIAVTPQTAIT